MMIVMKTGYKIGLLSSIFVITIATIYVYSLDDVAIDSDMIIATGQTSSSNVEPTVSEVEPLSEIEAKSSQEPIPIKDESKIMEQKPSLQKIDKSGFKQAPELVGISGYINTTPEELKEEMMKDKVVLYDIWTYSCINCKRTLPYVTSWDEKYSDQGLLIIGIHSPEFEFEKDINNVQKAVDKHGINYPVVQDNDFETWDAFENRY